MHTELSGPARPPITLIDTEAEALSNLAMAWLDRSAMGANLLLQELDRAETYDRTSLPPNVATMMSHVVYVDERSGEKREVQLVYPKDADIGAGRLSILTPVGAGLIGLRTGQAISWPDRTGKERLLTIARVKRPG